MVQYQSISHLPIGTRCGHYVLLVLDDPGEGHGTTGRGDENDE